MKKYAIITSLLTIVAVPAYAAIDCAVPPTCSDLGYVDTKSSCKGKFLPCPLDSTKNTGICVPSYSCADLGYKHTSSNCSTYIACPFDSSSVRCMETNTLGCDLESLRYYNGTKCTSTYVSGTTQGIYVGNGYILKPGIRYTGSYSSYHDAVTPLNNSCKEGGGVLASSNDLESTNGSDFGLLTGYCFATSNHTERWYAKPVFTSTCSYSNWYGLCKYKIF